MNNYVTEAINLKSYNLNDADKIIVMYSKENGLIKGVAKGIKKPKSKLGARMDLLVANSLQLLKGRSMDTIVQAQTVNHFRKTREVEVIELDISGKDKSLEFSLKSIDNYLGSNMSEAIEQTDAKFTPDGKATDISKQTKINHLDLY